jgi:signal transduction histidine kinase
VRRDLERIMSNLISNAVKFTPAGGSVTISAERTATEVHLRVVDTGVGVPAEDLENVFMRFFRSKSTELMPGTGLGLPITKALVEGLGGQITLTSDGTSGTNVLVSLPLATDAV